MQITIVMGFFLPVPPIAGGATEKSWYRLAQHFAANGHAVTMISRKWPGLDQEDPTPGICHLRLPGHDHYPSLRQNIWADFKWSCRVFRCLPPGDIVVVNCVTLPMWLGWLRPNAGKVVLMTGRVPKGQYRWYNHIWRTIAASSVVLDAVLHENPRLKAGSSVWGYPLDWRKLAESKPTTPQERSPAAPAPPITIGYIGRIHREKGLDLLAAGLNRLSEHENLPAWQFFCMGPSEVARGGSGEVYAESLRQRLQRQIGCKLKWQGPEFDSSKLIKHYQRIDIFCLPSLSENGETFGVAAAEAMAAGSAVIVSDLGCFRDFVISEKTGLVFNHRSPHADKLLASTLAGLLRDPLRRQHMAQAGQALTARYDFTRFGDNLLQEFAAANGNPRPSSHHAESNRTE